MSHACRPLSEVGLKDDDDDDDDAHIYSTTY